MWNRAAIGQGTAKRDSPQVVFVCEHGTVKSVVALEHFNRLAAARGLRVRAVSRGTHPDAAIPTPVRRGLEADGFEVATFEPRRLTANDLRSALLVVTLDADVSAFDVERVQVARWDSLPSVTASYAAGRNAIVARVERLVDSLAHAHVGRGRP
jgi:protein-tyrosine-phosphatase